MTRLELINSAIAHKQNKNVPYSMEFTTKGYKAYGERILADYPDARVVENYAVGCINLL